MEVKIEVYETPVSALAVGKAFISLNSEKSDYEMYMVVDIKSGCLRGLLAPKKFSNIADYVLAVNLRTGQPRWFFNNHKVKPVKATVIHD